MKNQLLDGLSTKELESALACLSPVRKEFSTGELIALRGDPAEHIGFVVSGTVSVCKDFFSGNQVVVMFLTEGECFAEAAAFSSNAVYPVTVIAKTSCVIDFFHIQPLAGACSSPCDGHIKIIQNLLRIIADRLWTIQRKLDVLSQKTLRGKITAFLLDLYALNHRKKFKLPFMRHEWASYLGVSRPSLSRELSWMRDEGLLEFSGKEIEIINVPALENCLDSL